MRARRAFARGRRAQLQRARSPFSIGRTQATDRKRGDRNSDLRSRRRGGDVRVTWRTDDNARCHAFSSAGHNRDGVTENVRDDSSQIAFQYLRASRTSGPAHDAGVIDEKVTSRAGCDETVEECVDRCGVGQVQASTSRRVRSLRARYAFSSTVRAGTITVAPASESTRVVSRPMPAYPPVTIAVMRLSLRLPSTSRAVDFALNPERSGSVEPVALSLMQSFYQDQLTTSDMAFRRGAHRVLPESRRKKFRWSGAAHVDPSAIRRASASPMCRCSCACMDRKTCRTESSPPCVVS